MKSFRLNFRRRNVNKHGKVISDDLTELKKQKIKNKCKYSLYLFTPLIIILLFLIYLISPFSKINHISISGNGYIPVNDIKKEMNINSGDSIFKVFGHKNKLNEQITKKDERIEAVNFSFRGLNNLNVNITHYNQVGYETRGKSQYIILENGKVTNVIEKNPNDKKLPYIVKFNNRDKLKSIIQKYLNLPKDIRDNIRVISYTPTNIYPDEMHLYMRDGNRVIILLSNFDYKMKFYRSIATQLKDKSVINLEVGAYSFPLKNEKREYTPLSKIISQKKANKNKSTTNKDNKNVNR